VARQTPSLSTLLGIGGVVALCLIAGMGLGWLADSRLHTFPALVLAGLALGIAGGCWYTYAEIRTFLNDDS
jgi:ABC-type xylose transport system permease subunit